MKPLLSFYLAFVFFLGACRKSECPIPNCIKVEIKRLKDSSCEHGAYVKEYEFQGATVYVSSIGFCARDGGAPVVNENCVQIGMLGGITGNTKVNGEEFSHAVLRRTLWDN
jgi:hypothetical protein